MRRAGSKRSHRRCRARSARWTGRSGSGRRCRRGLCRRGRGFTGDDHGTQIEYISDDSVLLRGPKLGDGKRLRQQRHGRNRLRANPADRGVQRRRRHTPNHDVTRQGGLRAIRWAGEHVQILHHGRLEDRRIIFQLNLVAHNLRSGRQERHDFLDDNPVLPVLCVNLARNLTSTLPCARRADPDVGDIRVLGECDVPLRCRPRRRDRRLRRDRLRAGAPVSSDHELKIVKIDDAIGLGQVDVVRRRIVQTPPG
jgi:hypothetical protein